MQVEKAAGYFTYTVHATSSAHSHSGLLERMVRSLPALCKELFLQTALQWELVSARKEAMRDGAKIPESGQNLRAPSKVLNPMTSVSNALRYNSRRRKRPLVLLRPPNCAIQRQSTTAHANIAGPNPFRSQCSWLRIGRYATYKLRCLLQFKQSKRSGLLRW